MKQQILDLTKEDQRIEITEDCELFGLYVGRDSDRLKAKLDIIHKLPRLKSLTVIKAIIYDESKFDLEGTLVIEKGAKHTDSYLKIDVLIMSDSAVARAVPSLEITEDDVKGGHGATIGQLDKEQLFYLMSRGLSEIEAEKVLVEGFVNDMFSQLESEVDIKKLKQLANL